METLIKCFNLILTGDKETSRMAARKMRKLVYVSSGDHDKYNDIKELINSSPSEYTKITEIWREENFVMAVSVMYFLHDRQEQPDFLFPWLFQLLQHENGNIRHAAVRMIEHELGSLTYHIRFPNRKSDPFHTLSSEQADRILRGLHSNLESLAANSYKPSYRRYKYINSLPSGTYKSVQHVLGCLEDYSREVHESIEIETKDEIIARRKEIEQELVEMLKEADPTSPRLRRGKEQFTLDDIKVLIYNEKGNDDFHKLIAMFDGSTSLTTGRGGDATELENVLELVSDAWNYFPHKVLGGISPAEKLLEHHNKNSHK